MFMKELESQLLADLGESCLAVLGSERRYRQRLLL